MAPRRKIIPIFVPHAGCPNQCVFCDQKRISGSLHAASSDTVHRTLQPLVRHMESCELAFYGGSFTAIEPERQKELLEAVRPYRACGLISSIRVSTRPDAIDEGALRRLREGGVQTVELGAQSMTDEVLRASGRGHTAEDTRRAAHMVREAGFNLVLQMMTGLPSETRETSLITARELAALRPDGVRIYPTVIIRGTELERMWKAGEYREHTVEDAVDCCASILPIFEAAEIPVIRLGLNPTDELSGGVAVGGAYHPALGELVKSRMWLERAREVLRDVPAGSSVKICVPSASFSQMTGQHRCNIDTLCREFSLSKLKIGSLKGESTEKIRIIVAKNEDLR